MDKSITPAILLSILRLPAGLPEDESDMLQAELTRRLVATMALMDHLFVPFLDIERPIMRLRPLPRLFSYDEFDALRLRLPNAPTTPSAPNLMQEIINLSDIYFDACRSCKTAGCPQEDLRVSVISSLVTWRHLLPDELQDTDANFEMHRTKFILRPFGFLHMLHNQIWQIVLLDHLEWTSDVLRDRASPLQPQVLDLYDRAAWVAKVVRRAWEVARLDLHNSCFGLIVIITQTILVHRFLTSSDLQQTVATQSQMRCLRDCLIRVKDRCRLLNSVVSL